MEELGQKPAVSVIIPAYNVENYIEKCLDSVLNQTFQDFEIVIINDGSTDSSQLIIDDYKDKYGDKIITYFKDNSGVSDTRNFALLKARGEYITFLDSDDYLKDDYLSVLYNEAKRKNRDMVVSGQFKIHPEGNVLDEIIYPIDKNGQCVLRKLNFAGKIYKRSFIESNNLRFPAGKTYEDNPFNLQALFLAKEIIFLSYVGYYQVVRSGSITTKRIDKEKIPFEALEEAIKYVMSNEKKVNNLKLFEFTVLSFFTYFIFQANKSHQYASFENRKSDWEVVQSFCTFSIQILKQYFPLYWKNPYIGIFSPKELQVLQRVGVWGYVHLCKLKLLDKFVYIYYKL